MRRRIILYSLDKVSLEVHNCEVYNLKSLLQYNKTAQHSIGPYGYKYADDGERVPPQITITFYSDLQLHPANYTYNNSDPPFQSTMGKKLAGS